MITVKLVLWVKFYAVKLLNSVRLNSPRVQLYTRHLRVPGLIQCIAIF